MGFLQGAQQRCAIHTGHPHIRYDHIEFFVTGKFNGGSRTGGKNHVPVRTHAAQPPPQAVQDVFVIINEQDIIHKIGPCHEN
jgi:hypothetical protein